jgi:hypothetical protein
MGLGLKAAAAATVLFLTGTAADAAWAQSKTDPGSKSSLASSEGRWGLPGTKRSLQAAKGRWDVNVAVDPGLGQDPKQDVEAGAFFRIAPGLKVGGAVRLGDKALKERGIPEDRASRVKVETKFRF